MATTRAIADHQPQVVAADRDDVRARHVVQPVGQIGGGDRLRPGELDQHDAVERERAERGDDGGHPTVGDDQPVDRAQHQTDQHGEERPPASGGMPFGASACVPTT